jgi:hypothetical protein
VSSLIRSQATKDKLKFTYDDKSIEGILHFNVCGFMDTVPDCGNTISGSNAYLKASDNVCYNLLPSDRSQNTYKLFSESDPKTKNTAGFVISHSKTNFQVEITCDSTVENPLFDIYDNVLVVKSKDACGSVNIVSQFIGENKYVFCSLVILLGLLLLFIAGNKWDVILATLGFSLSVSAVLFFFYVMVDFKYDAVSYTVIIILSLTIGGIVAYLSYNSVFISYIIIGFPAGFLIAKLILLAVNATVPDVS